MENGYNISIVDECDGALTRVYLEPQCSHASHRRKLGYIENNVTFHSLNDSLMTIEVMNSLCNAWYNYDRNKQAKALAEQETLEEV